MQQDIFEFIDEWKSGNIFITGVNFEGSPYEDNHQALTNLYHVDAYDNAMDGYQHGISDDAYSRVWQDLMLGSLLLTHADMGRNDRRHPIIAVDEIISDPEWCEISFVDGTYRGEFWAFYVDRIAHSPWGLGAMVDDLFADKYNAYLSPKTPSANVIYSRQDFENRIAQNRNKVMYLEKK